jgi:hypothetical protein
MTRFAEKKNQEESGGCGKTRQYRAMILQRILKKMCERWENAMVWTMMPLEMLTERKKLQRQRQLRLLQCLQHERVRL